MGDKLMKKNELLEQDIIDKIEDARYVKPEKKNNRHSLFYLIVVFLVTVSVIFSLLRFF